MLEEGDLLVMRHGESEGNAANRLSENGDKAALAALYENRHSYHLRLSQKGCEQGVAIDAAQGSGLRLREVHALLLILEHGPSARRGQPIHGL